MKTLPLVAAAVTAAGITAAVVAYSNSDWAAAANPPVNPAALWQQCLTETTNPLDGAAPGIDTGSHLYYHPLIGDGRRLTGWQFYGNFRRDSDIVTFECVTSADGSTVAWR